MEKRNVLAQVFVIIMVLVFISCDGNAKTIYVAPDGNDAWAGILPTPNSAGSDGPLATLRGARNMIRRLKQKGALTEAVEVVVRDGTYPLSEPFVLKPEDSGSADAPIVYRAAEGAKPVFTGGRVLKNMASREAGVYSVHLPEAASGAWYFEQLWVNGHRAVRARTPDKFYFYMQDVKEEKLGAGGGRRPAKARQAITVTKEVIDILAALDKKQLCDVQLQIYHKWDNTRRFIDAIDREKRQVITSGRGMKPWNRWRKGTRFHLENAKTALNKQGEWFLSRNGTLTYIARKGERVTEMVAPRLERFVLVEGAPEKNQFVQHVSFKGLSFQHGSCVTPPEGFEASQAASPVDAVFLLDGARHVTIENCEIAHVGRYGLWFRRGCSECRLERSFLHDFGAGGVRIGETSIRKSASERTHHITIDNNIIHHGGYIFPCAVGVWIGQSGHNIVTHNDIGDLFYTGISVGWRWGYAESLAQRNTITWNHVHHIGKGVLSDMGGIYTLGPSPGTVVRYNIFHDVYAYGYGGWGLYTDEGSSGIIMEKNLVYNVKTGGFHQHYGKENIVRNNILAFSRLYQVQATRVENHRSFTFENNIVYYELGVLLSGPWKKIRITMDKNCYWNCAGIDVNFIGDDIEKWRETTGHDRNSVIADPLFSDPSHHDFHLKAESPAVKLGFTPWEYTKAGVYGSAAWKAQAEASPMPSLELPPKPGK